MKTKTYSINGDQFKNFHSCFKAEVLNCQLINFEFNNKLNIVTFNGKSNLTIFIKHFTKILNDITHEDNLKLFGLKYHEEIKAEVQFDLELLKSFLEL